MTQSPGQSPGQPAGMFIWYELMTPNADGATAFYNSVIGWTIAAQNPVTHSGTDYRMIGRSDGGSAGGVLALSSSMLAEGARPGWLGYLHVADVDAAAKRIVAQSGAILMAAQTMPGVGRMAMLADPQGAPIYIMTPTPPADNPDAASDVFSVTEPQHVRWNELQSSDPEASVAFYTSHFGWTQQGDMDMGPMGKYRFVQHGDVVLGAIMGQMPNSPHSAWFFYFGVDDIDRAVAAVSAGGGTLTGPIQPVPGGDSSIHCSDPQGVAFGLVGPRKA